MPDEVGPGETPVFEISLLGVEVVKTADDPGDFEEWRMTATQNHQGNITERKLSFDVQDNAIVDDSGGNISYIDEQRPNYNATFSSLIDISDLWKDVGKQKTLSKDSRFFSFSPAFPTATIKRYKTDCFWGDAVEFKVGGFEDDRFGNDKLDNTVDRFWVTTNDTMAPMLNGKQFQAHIDALSRVGGSIITEKGSASNNNTKSPRMYLLRYKITRLANDTKGDCPHP